MDKMIEIWESDENFVGWAKEFSQKLGGDFREQFDKSWPKVRSHDTQVIARIESEIISDIRGIESEEE